jgi:RNA polymerase sigma factor (sigma-70 family)
MGRFYEKRLELDAEKYRCFVSITQTNSQRVEIEVTKPVYDALDDLQRDHWRQERSESRHTCHIEMMRESELPHYKYSKDPEQLLIEQIEATEIQQALHSLPLIQQKRFLLRHLIGLTIKQIAQLEGCSERAVKYSLKLARENLREMLS